MSGDAPRAEAIRSRLLGEGETLDAAERAKALSDPTRLTLAEALGEGGELCVCDIVRVLVWQSQIAVSMSQGGYPQRATAEFIGPPADKASQVERCVSATSESEGTRSISVSPHTTKRVMQTT